MIRTSYDVLKLMSYGCWVAGTDGSHANLTCAKTLRSNMVRLYIYDSALDPTLLHGCVPIVGYGICLFSGHPFESYARPHHSVARRSHVPNHARSLSASTWANGNGTRRPQAVLDYCCSYYVSMLDGCSSYT